MQRWFLVTLGCLCLLVTGAKTVRAGRIPPEHWMVPEVRDVQPAKDFIDGDDPQVMAHWALLVAGSAGWGNYRHQADVFHAYQVLTSGGYSPDRIVVMAFDDIAHDPGNPMPGKVFNRPGGPNVYSGVQVDYRGEDVTAETFLAVLEGNKAAVAGKGSSRVIASGPNDKVFVFYSDHGAAGVVGMPAGPFLYADQLIKSLKKKFHHKGFKEIVLYIEACESGSMFEGLLDDGLSAYVTTAANAFESSWATYCPEFFGALTDGSGSTSTSTTTTTTTSSKELSSSQSWLMQRLHDGLAYLEHWISRGAAPADSSSGSSSSSSQHGPPTPQLTTCLGDLYSVSWMEDAELSDLTQETLLQQYRSVKKRTSMNFTYEQGSHVMQYGALTIDHEVAGDYQGMLHNGSLPPSPTPSPDWVEFEQHWHQQQQRRAGGRYLMASRGSQHSHSRGQGSSVLQRDADLVPLRHAAKHSHCPRKRAAAAKALQQVEAEREVVDAAAAAAVADLIKHPLVGHILVSNLGWLASDVLPPAALLGSSASSHEPTNSKQQQQHQQQHSPLQLGNRAEELGEVPAAFVQQLLSPLPGREGQPLVESWDCLREFVQVWESHCGRLDQYGMKHTRLFANLCNAGVHPEAMADVFLSRPCRAP